MSSLPRPLDPAREGVFLHYFITQPDNQLSGVFSSFHRNSGEVGLINTQLVANLQEIAAMAAGKLEPEGTARMVPAGGSAFYYVREWGPYAIYDQHEFTLDKCPWPERELLQCLEGYMEDLDIILLLSLLKQSFTFTVRVLLQAFPELKTAGEVDLEPVNRFLLARSENLF